MQYSIQHNRHFLGKFSASQQCLYTAVVCPWLYVSMSLTASGSPGSIPALPGCWPVHHWPPSACSRGPGMHQAAWCFANRQALHYLLRVHAAWLEGYGRLAHGIQYVIFALVKWVVKGEKHHFHSRVVIGWYILTKIYLIAVFTFWLEIIQPNVRFRFAAGLSGKIFLCWYNWNSFHTVISMIDNTFWCN